MNVAIRPARPDDCRLYYEWSMDDETRANSVRHARFSYEDHERWWDLLMTQHDTFGSSTALILILEVDGVPAGQVRYAAETKAIGSVVDDAPTIVRTGDVEVSISIAREFRGQRLATPLLRQSEPWAREHLGAKVLIAHILPSNVASVRSFERAGYIYAGVAVQANKVLLRFDRGPCRFGGMHGPDLLPCGDSCFEQPATTAAASS